MNTPKLYGADGCCAKAYRKENNLDFDFIDVDLNADATAEGSREANGDRSRGHEM